MRLAGIGAHKTQQLGASPTNAQQLDAGSGKICVVESFLARRLVSGVVMLLTKWSTRPEDHATWEVFDRVVAHVGGGRAYAAYDWKPATFENTRQPGAWAIKHRSVAWYWYAPTVGSPLGRVVVWRWTRGKWSVETVAATSNICEEADAPAQWGLYRAWSEHTYHGLGSQHRLGRYTGDTIGPRFATEQKAVEWVLEHHPHERYMLPCRRHSAWRVINGEFGGNGLRLHLMNDKRLCGMPNVGITNGGEAIIVAQVECFDFSVPDLGPHQRLSELSMSYGAQFAF